MKNLKVGLILFGLLGIASLTIANNVKRDTGAVLYEYSDTIKHEAPVFNGTEEKLTDSLDAISRAVTDTAVKNVINEAIEKIGNTPKGNSFTDWLKYGVTAVLALVALFFYLKSVARKYQVDNLKQRGLFKTRQESKPHPFANKDMNGNTV